MANRKNNASDEDLFKREVGAVKPLHHKLAPTQSARAEGPLPLKSEDAGVERGEVLQFLRSGIQTATFQKLRRGQFPVEDTLDLHGFTTAEASHQLQRFILQSRSTGRRSVRIVHGKGRGSPGAPVLKTKINRWLREIPSVLAFCSSHPRDGGTGAVDVLLRK